MTSLQIVKYCRLCGEKFSKPPKQSWKQFDDRGFCSSSCSGSFNIRIAKGGWNSTSHERTGTPEYRTWASMKRRCHNPRHKLFYRYGGRGISVCVRWLNFENFFADMGERPPGGSLDRIDNEGNYEPGNCRWASRLEQARNTSKTCRITIDGVTRCASEWSEISGIPQYIIAYRFRVGYPSTEMLSPVRIIRHG